MPSNLRLFRFIFHNLLNLTIAPVLLCCNLSKAFNGNPSLILVQLRFVTAKRNRRCIGGPVSSHQRIFICSKTVVTAVNPISHNPRFHTGLRAVRQSNGFMVGTKADSLLQATDFNESLLYLAKIKIFNSRLQQVSALIRIEMCKI